MKRIEDTEFSEIVKRNTAVRYMFAAPYICIGLCLLAYTYVSKFEPDAINSLRTLSVVLLLIGLLFIILRSRQRVTLSDGSPVTEGRIKLTDAHLGIIGNYIQGNYEPGTHMSYIISQDKRFLAFQFQKEGTPLCEPILLSGEKATIVSAKLRIHFSED